MTSFCSKTRLSAIGLVVVAVLCICGCDNPVDLIGQANGYTALVAQGMALRGFDGFPSNPVSLALWAKALKESISDAKDGVLSEGVGGEETVEDEPSIQGKWWR